MNCHVADIPLSNKSASASATEVVRFALVSQPLPRVGDTLWWGDVARRAAMSRYGRRNAGGVSPALSGKDPAGKPMQGHRHPFYLPIDEDGDGRLDQLTILTPGGLSAEEFDAITSIDALHPGGSRRSVRICVEGQGCVADFRSSVPIFGVSSRWRSLTPFVLPRHVKFRGPRDDRGFRRMVDGPEDQIAREYSARWSEGPKLVRVKRRDPGEPILPMAAGKSSGLPPFEFFRHRHSGSNGGGAFNFLLELEAPIPGPVALGFGCHYGLGLFVPA